MKPSIIHAKEELIIESFYPEWHLLIDGSPLEILVDFNLTKKIVFKMANGKVYYFSHVKTVDASEV